MNTQTALPWQGGPVELTIPLDQGSVCVFILQDGPARIQRNGEP